MARKRRKTRKVKRKTKKHELIPYKLHCPIKRFKLKDEKVVAFSDSLKGYYVTCH